MNKKIGIIAGIAAIIIIVLSIIFTQGNGGNPLGGDVSPTPASNVYNTPEPVQPHTYQEFLKSGRSEICTFSINSGGNATSGTVYAAYGKIRTDFAITGGKGTLQQHLLIDSYMAYMWNNATNGGVKFAVVETEENQPFISRLNMNCNDWSPSLSVFEIPSNISFMEITESTAQIYERYVPTITSAPNGQ